jgi:hypothetical protein
LLTFRVWAYLSGGSNWSANALMICSLRVM